MSQPDLAEYLRLQGHYCGKLGSPLYESLLDRAADDLAAGGVVAAVLDGYPLEPIYSAMALRLMGNVHRLVLEGRAPALAAHYPSAGGDGDAMRAWPAFHRPSGVPDAGVPPRCDSLQHPIGYQDARGSGGEEGRRESCGTEPHAG